MSQSRQSHLDSLRGVAALIVVSTHYFTAFFPYTVFGAQGGYQQHSGWENTFFFPPFGLIISGPFAVCLFFILSGYVLSYNHLGKSWQGHKILSALLKRPIRLGGLVWLSIIIGSMLWYCGLFFNGAVSDLTTSKQWFGAFWAGNFNLHKFFVDLSTSSFSRGDIYNPPLWTIKIELYGSMMIYIFALLLGRFKYRLLISILLVFAFKNSLYQGFWIGLCIADIIKNHPFQKEIRSINVYHSLLFILFFYLSSYPHYVDSEFLASTIYAPLPDDKGFGGGYLMLSALIIFILAVSNRRLQEYLNLPALQFLGRISYGLYVMHFLILGSLSSWLVLILTNYFGYNISFCIAFFAGLSLTILSAYLATKYVDNTSIRLANFLGKKAIAITALSPIKNLFLRVEKLMTIRST
jgi:peptidoglycan/LPS O-acetylase OafA/YrhL